MRTRERAEVANRSIYSVVRTDENETRKYWDDEPGFLVVRVGKNPGFIKKKPNPLGFFGFYWVLLGFFVFFWVLLF